MECQKLKALPGLCGICNRSQHDEKDCPDGRWRIPATKGLTTARHLLSCYNCGKLKCSMINMKNQAVKALSNDKALLRKVILLFNQISFLVFFIEGGNGHLGTDCSKPPKDSSTNQPSSSSSSGNRNTKYFFKFYSKLSQQQYASSSIHYISFYLCFIVSL